MMLRADEELFHSQKDKQYVFAFVKLVETKPSLTPQSLTTSSSKKAEYRRRRRAEESPEKKTQRLAADRERRQRKRLQLTSINEPRLLEASKETDGKVIIFSS